MRGAVKARRHPRHGAAARWSGGTGEQRCGGVTVGVSQRGGEDGADKWTPRVSGWIERRRQERKALTQGESTLLHLRQRRARLSGLGRLVGFSVRERRGQWEPTGPKAEWAARSAGPKVRKKNF
jgi:hypothetical protein